MVKTSSRIDRFGSVLIYGHHLLIVCVGVFGMVEDPSPAVVTVIGGRIAATIWSFMFTVFGGLALGCRFANRRKWLDTTRSEALCIALIGAAMFLFGMLIAFSTTITHSPGSWQTALILLAGSVFLPGVAALSLAATRRERLMQVDHTNAILVGIADQIRRDTGTV